MKILINITSPSPDCKSRLPNPEFFVLVWAREKGLEKVPAQGQGVEINNFFFFSPRKLTKPQPGGLYREFGEGGALTRYCCRGTAAEVAPPSLAEPLAWH